ncbi:3'-5' exonuclease [Bacillus sp. m3-13]|uniref:3'-5' exonuclease n=1 Tax=Bacillus sp. m3-13 TaxID=406124 RepID=UPI0001E89C3C|nr:3'-5' exonuclease [Bacillus sp. m3-13]
MEKYRFSIGTIQRALQKEGIPATWITEDEASKRAFNREEETVKISTIDSSKGLDFQAVFIVKADTMPFPLEKDKEREVSLMYIGMTRAKEYLCISYSGSRSLLLILRDGRKKGY